MPAVLPHARVALNPIQWMATPDAWVDPAIAPALPDLLALTAKAGFSAIHAQVPTGWAVADYARALADAGLAPAPGYLSLPLPGEEAALPDLLDQARRMAADHAALGLADMFVAARMQKGTPRVLHPAVGHGFDAARFDRLVAQISAVAAVLAAEGIHAALHPHIGTWIETEAETRAMLDSVGARILGFGPDTGHLSWAAADLAGLIADYRDRIRVLHVKDCNQSRCRAAVAAGLSYQETVLTGIWAEPGTGELDLTGLLSGLGAGFDGWLIAEVDFPTLPPFECAKACAAWFGARE